AIARLRDGVSFSQAASDMRAIFADLEREFPRLNARRTVMLLPLQEQMVGEIRPALLALVAAVGLVLLVGCVNVANLLLARSAAREREVGLRTALGARRGRLVRQMLTESLVLAAGGGMAGLGVAALCHRGLLVLLAGAGLLMRSLLKLQSVDLGFRVDGVLAATVQLPTPRYDFLASGNLFRDAMARIAALPGVQSVAGASCMPMPFPCIGTT